MPTFDELAQQSNCPVIRSQRSDKATLIATRVPLDDIRLERWGWVLTLCSIDGRTDQNDIETLRDNAGRQFPKVYLFKDMQNYIERWSCGEWEEGYHNGHLALGSSSTHTIADPLHEDMIKQLFHELQEHQAHQAATLMEELKAQLENMHGETAQDKANFYQMLQEHIIDAYNRVLERSRTSYEDTTKQLQELKQEVDAQSINVTQAIEAQCHLVRDETDRHLATITEEVKRQTTFSGKHVLEEVEIQFAVSKADIIKQLEEKHEEVRTGLTDFTTELKTLEDQIKLALLALDPDADEDMGKTETADAATTATKIVRKATTQIERITQSHQKMSMNYFNSANEQSRQGFKLAWSLIFTAIGVFIFTVVAAVFMAILHLYGFAALMGSIGMLGTAIVTIMGAISSFHAKTAEQFALAQKLLDRSYRPTIANSMCVGYTNEAHKEAAIDKIIDGLLKNDTTDVALK